MPLLTKINTNVIADNAVTAAKTSGTAEQELTTSANIDLSGTTTGQKLQLGDAFTLTGDLTVNHDLVLGKVRDDGTGQSLTGDGKTLTGTGTLTMGSSYEGEPKAGRVTSVDGMTGTLGSGVTGNPALNLSNATQFPAGHVIKTGHVQAAGQSTTTSQTWNTIHNEVVLTFTPLFGTSSILLHASMGIYKATGGYAQFDFYKNASDFTETYNVTGLDYGLALVNSLTHWSGLSMQWLDPVTENSTTEKTYKISLRSTDGNTAYCGWGAEGMSSITAWEIAQ